MAIFDPVLIDLPMPIGTPRLTIRPKQVGDGAITSSAVLETWEELNRWMRWAENRDSFTPESMEIRNRHVMASFLLRESVELIGIETRTGEAVVWCGLHDIDWQARQCDTGYWVRKSAQGRGIATETANAMVRYAFGVLGMQRVGLTQMNNEELPIVPHSDFGDPDCCGCLITVERVDQVDIVCNDCGAVVRTVPSPEAVQALLQMAIAHGACSATCPHCGALNTFPGWSSIQAYVCRECGEGVVVRDPLQ
jgi:ribosomal-protein-serine acetyltransferase